MVAVAAVAVAAAVAAVAAVVVAQPPRQWKLLGWQWQQEQQHM